MKKRAAMARLIPGVNIQWPWSALLVAGAKTVETRGYPLPVKYVGRELAIIETPGPRGKRDAGIDHARVIGTVVFCESIQYKTRAAWVKDRRRHLVQDDDPIFAFCDGIPKWGWVVAQIRLFDQPLPAPKRRGIVFASNCQIPASASI